MTLKGKSTSFLCTFAELHFLEGRKERNTTPSRVRSRVSRGERLPPIVGGHGRLRFYFYPSILYQTFILSETWNCDCREHDESVPVAFLSVFILCTHCVSHICVCIEALDLRLERHVTLCGSSMYIQIRGPLPAYIYLHCTRYFEQL